ncbi:hypothetical protein DSM19430T_25130 [Desulfovibrio psychrotolerans]|uniref:Uncharacterized protein n=1 Tax=Desulfovibrio psychrotolerans TaxID=415242 RepID=A0A7J0BVU3_9BACT|nr:hypothetical protein DSM19430T_25130 [Desulfovibrio psychrotolerans]
MLSVFRKDKQQADSVACAGGELHPVPPVRWLCIGGALTVQSLCRVCAEPGQSRGMGFYYDGIV